MSVRIVKTEEGFYRLENPPSKEELKKYYSEKYYQEAYGGYSHSYSEEEKNYILSKIEQKYLILERLIPESKTKRRFIDIGAGEGWALRFFNERDWEVKGLDYSDFGCRQQNPEFLDRIIVGDIFENLTSLIFEKKKYDCIWLNNVLEHVLEPMKLLEDLRQIANDSCVLMIDVPNDFSLIQKDLLERKIIDFEFWIFVPDHISYFNKEGLINLCKKAGWTLKDMIADYPIDFNLYNPNTNYVLKKEVGKSCHNERVIIENLLHKISPEKTNNLYRAMADLGIGRSIVGFFQREKEVKKYRCLKQDVYSMGELSLVSVRSQDIMLIMKWRNEQIDVLRQKTLLTPEMQVKYYEENVWNTFDMDYPPQILFSYLRGEECIGYGGLVHISWEDKRAEVSFILDKNLISDENIYCQLFSTFLTILKKIAFEELDFNRIYVETYDIRAVHIACLEKNGFRLEGRMRENIRIKDKFYDSLIHGILKSDYLDYENYK